MFSNLVHLSLLTMTNPNQLCDVLLFLCSKMADETNLSSKLPVADRSEEESSVDDALALAFRCAHFCFGFADSFCFVFTSSPFYEALRLCTILCNLFPYGELQVGKCSHGGQKKRYKDTLKASLKDFNIPTESWEQIAQDRTKDLFFFFQDSDILAPSFSGTIQVAYILSLGVVVDFRKHGIGMLLVSDKPIA